MKPYYWYNRQPPRRRPRRWLLGVAIAGVAGLLAAAAALWIFRRDPHLPFPHLPRIAGPLPRPQGWASFEQTPGPPGALLRIDGATPLSGVVEMICSPLAPAGVQIALHTGVPALPVVAVRFASLAAAPGATGAAGEIALTGRDAAGALVGSSGRAELTLAHREPTPGRPGETFAGTIHGTFHGAAGQGEIEVRLRGCTTGPPPPGIWGRVPERGESAGVKEET